MINRGGEKIAPREVDEALLAHPAVAEAVSFPVPHARLHQDIAAAIVPHNGSQVTGDELRRFLARRLAAFKVPHVILCVAELPKGPTGKLVRTDLAAHFGLGAEVAPSRVQPPTKYHEMLLALWREVLKRQDIGCDDDFFSSAAIPSRPWICSTALRRNSSTNCRSRCWWKRRRSAVSRFALKLRRLARRAAQSPSKPMERSVHCSR